MFASAIILSAYVIGRITDRLIIPVLDDGESINGRLCPRSPQSWESLCGRQPG